MADRPTGPVKPPVIDLTARTGASRPEAANADSPSASAASSSSSSSSRRGVDTTSLIERYGVLLTVIIGIVVAAVLAWIISSANRPAPVADVSPQLVAQSERLDALETEFGALKKTTDGTQAGLDSTIAELHTGLETLKQSIADVQASIPAAQPAVDLAPLETEIRTLKAQVDAIAAGASGADAGAIAQSLAALQTSIDSLTTRLNGVDATVASLRTDLDTARKSLDDHITNAGPNEAGPAAKLPLILSGLESAFATGKPFQAELASLKTVMPDVTVSSSLDAAATTGLMRPDELMQKFETALPEILAARGPASGDWVQNGIDWAKSLLAIRPIDEVEGTSPEAIVSRLEGAMGRRDYSGAVTLIASLPQPMQDAAAPVAADIGAHADADKLVADLRARALGPVETAQ